MSIGSAWAELQEKLRRCQNDRASLQASNEKLTRQLKEVLKYGRQPTLQPGTFHTINQEVYKSSTHGPIKLSFTGRRLLQNLRDAVIRAIEARDFGTDGAMLSQVRAHLAIYMGDLETRVNSLLPKPATDPAEKVSLRYVPSDMGQLPGQQAGRFQRCKPEQAVDQFLGPLHGTYAGEGRLGTPLRYPHAPEPSLAEKVAAYAAKLEEAQRSHPPYTLNNRAQLAREVAAIIFRAEEQYKAGK